MKNLILIRSMLALAIVLGLMGVGCSKSNSNSAGNVATPAGGPNPATPIIIDPIGPGQPGDPGAFGTGFTADLITTNAQMRAYTTIAGSLTTVNNPTNIKINLNLAQSEAGRYGGAVTITYTDNGQPHTGVLRAGMGRNQVISGGYDNNELQSKYNYWFTLDNKLSFTGFFEDEFGAIVISLEPDAAIGGGSDGEPISVKYKGSVYFRNFNTVKTTPDRSCWFIYTGLNGHDCRSSVIQTKVGLAPGDGAGYTLLGTFTNVDIKQAFNTN